MPKNRRHYRITLGDVIGAHERALQFGGRPGIQNVSLIESAIGRPYTGYYRPIARKAAALVESMATNHGFVDGNKRTTVYLMACYSKGAVIRLRCSDAVRLLIKSNK